MHEAFYSEPETIARISAFGKVAVDMWIPFKRTPESMKDANKVFGKNCEICCKKLEDKKMLRMRKRAISMLLAGIVCAAAIPGGSVAVSAQEERMDTKEVISTEEIMDLDEFVYEAVEKGDADSKGYTDYLEPDLEGEEGLSVQSAPKGAERANHLQYGDYTYVIQEDGTVEISRYSGTEKT